MLLFRLVTFFNTHLKSNPRYCFLVVTFIRFGVLSISGKVLNAKWVFAIQLWAKTTVRLLHVCNNIYYNNCVPLLHFYFQYVLPMELITSESFGKWMQIFQTVIARDVPQVWLYLKNYYYFHYCVYVWEVRVLTSCLAVFSPPPPPHVRKDKINTSDQYLGIAMVKTVIFGNIGLQCVEVLDLEVLVLDQEMQQKTRAIADHQGYSFFSKQ